MNQSTTTGNGAAMPAGERHLHVVLISVHGLIRGQNFELGRDADTGGQTRYVVELAQALSEHPEIARVDLLTRRVLDSAVSADYARREEALSEGARFRSQCGLCAPRGGTV
jgi:sucrose-phosphate synthase